MSNGIHYLAGLVGLVLLAPAALGREDTDRGKTHVYTNEDLERVSPRRGETGVLSQPAVSAATPRAALEDGGRGRDQEPYWRGQARRLRERFRKANEEIAALRARVDQRRRLPGVSPATDPRVRAWQERIGQLEARIREAEIELEDRARREGALPGWLRP